MILRDYCVNWIIGWVAWWITFMFVFFTLEKLVLKSGSTPPRYLAIYRASQAFSYRNPNTSLIPGGSIKKAPASSIVSRHLVDRSSFCSWIWCVVPRYLLDTSAVDDHFPDTYLDSFLDTCIYRALLRVYIYLLHDPNLISSICINLSAHVHLPNTLSLTPNLFLCDFSSFFKIFLLLVSF